MRIRCLEFASVALALSGAPVWCQEGQGLDASTSTWLAGQWQARVALAHASTHSSFSDPYNIAAHAHGAQWPGRGVLGDFFFQSAATGTVPATFSGFRATSGLIVSPRSFGAPSSPSALLGGKNNDGSAFPYLGIGYTELPGRTGWGFSADFGLMAMNPRSTVKFGSALTGPQSIDELLRDLRLLPLLQVGVSYSF